MLKFGFTTKHLPSGNSTMEHGSVTLIIYLLLHMVIFIYFPIETLHVPEDARNITNKHTQDIMIPSGERLHSNGKIHHFIAGKIHYFDWAIFHSKC